MSFGEVFTEIRSRRRIRTREFEGIPSSYITAIEKKDLLPGRDRLGIILSHIGEVALEQGSENGEIEQEELQAAWWESQMVRLGVDPQLAPTIARFVQLDPKNQAVIAQAVEKVNESPVR